MRRAIVRALFAGDGSLLRHEIPLREFSALRLSNGWNAERQMTIESATPNTRFEHPQHQAIGRPIQSAFSFSLSGSTTCLVRNK